MRFRRTALKAADLVEGDVSGRGRLDSRIVRLWRRDWFTGCAGGGGLRGCLSRKQRATPAVARIFRREGSDRARAAHALDAVVGEQGNSASSIARDSIGGRSHSQTPSKCWVIPTNSAFVGRRAGRLHAAARFAAGLPGGPRSNFAETRVPIHAAGASGGMTMRAQRHGQPLQARREGWRRVKVTDRHTAVDYAVLTWPISISRRAGRNLNIHSTIYEAFPESQTAGPIRIIRQSTAAGLLAERNRRPIECLESPTNKPSSRKSPPGSTTRPIGTSQPQTLASNSYTRTD